MPAKRRKSRPIRDEDIVEMIKRGHLVVKVEGEEIRVFKLHRRKLQYLSVSPTYHPLSGRARFNIRLGDDQMRTIYRNRLVALATTLAAVPEGYDVDHRDHDRTNDLPENLDIRPSGENRADNWSAENLQEVLDFFDNPEGES